jgi:Tat protein translocase TatB subunit
VGSIGPAEIIVVLIIGLIVLGPSRLPDAARQVGKAMSEFRKVTSGLQAEVRDAFTEPVPGSPPTAQPAPAPAQPVAEIAAGPDVGPAPWANPPIPVEGPPRTNGAEPVGPAEQ